MIVIKDKKDCCGCHACMSVCPAIYQGQERLPLKVYASRNKDERILLESSSGGIFSLLASVVIRQGGVVFGVRYDKDWNTVHSWTDSDEGLADFRGAKYVQSRIGTTFHEVESFHKAI